MRGCSVTDWDIAYASYLIETNVDSLFQMCHDELTLATSERALCLQCTTSEDVYLKNEVTGMGDRGIKANKISYIQRLPSPYTRCPRIPQLMLT